MIEPVSVRADPMPQVGKHRSFNTKEIEMALLLRESFIVTAAAAALTASSVGPALAQTTAHGHDAAAVHKLTLNQSRNGASDEPLRAGMGRIHGLVKSQLSAADAGKLTPAQYRELAPQAESEVGGIVAHCKLEPKVDAMLHLVIADPGAGTDAMAGKHAKLRAAIYSVKTGCRGVRMPLNRIHR